MSDVTVQATPENFDVALGGDVADYVALLKPRVMFLVVFTALVGLVAAPGTMHPVLAIAALICIAVGAGASGALNMWYDADIDARMARTAARPVPQGAVTPQEALAFGTVLAIGSVMCLGLMANWVAAGLLALHHRLLCVRLHDVAEALDAAEHRHWRRRGCLAAGDRLGGSDRHGEPRVLRDVPDHLRVDAAPFLGAGLDPRARLRARRRAHASRHPRRR